ncbi:hypothetical protein NVS55_26220 [Myxococcus stipitatus]|uniref:hypothetical protein n=1 Tax=Myxococcus stipitatus TaxID=83455 RepID=UPI003145194C
MSLGRVIPLSILLVSVAAGCERRSSSEPTGWKAVDGGIVCEGGGLQHLACTGLYGEGGKGWGTKTVAREVRAYEPGFQLWSDGLEKARYVYLPPGTRVETSKPDEWRFPPGTKFWKEFRWKGRPIETRLLWKKPNGTWLRTTYRWSDDGKRATELTDGEKKVPDTGTPGHEIPSQTDCVACHGGREDEVLGFEAVSLAHESAKGLTLAKLVEEGLLSHPPEKAPRVPGTPLDQDALGYLHMNCGVSCHNTNPLALGGASGLMLRLEAAELGGVEQTDAWKTSVGVRSFFRTTGLFGDSVPRVAPGDVKRSTMLHRMNARGLPVQMPPLGTHVVDKEGVARVQRWIESLPVPQEQ